MSIVLKSERLQKLMQKKAKIESDLARLEKAEKTAARKLDSRRKIVIGAAVMKAIFEGRIQEPWARNLIANFASERDKSIFEDFTFPTAEHRETDGVASAQRE